MTPFEATRDFINTTVVDALIAADDGDINLLARAVHDRYHPDTTGDLRDTLRYLVRNAGTIDCGGYTQRDADTIVEVLIAAGVTLPTSQESV